MNSYWAKCAKVSPVEMALVIVEVLLFRFHLMGWSAADLQKL